MKETGSQPKHKRRQEGLFLLCAVLTAAACVALAVWFAPPRLGPSGRTEDLTLVQLIRVDLNTADASTLCLLPEIGEKRAQAILDYRQAHGAFHRVTDVLAVPGVTEEIVAAWGELAYVS